MYEVVILTLGDGASADGNARSCLEALAAAGAPAEAVTATSDAEIDEVLTRLDAPPRPDGLTWPDWPNPEGRTRLAVAAASDGELRAVVRRLVRRYAPPPSRRPTDLPATRTVPDLPPIGVLPLDGGRGPIGAASGGAGVDGEECDRGDDLVARLGLPRDPAAVASAILAGRFRRLDLLRTDAGSVTLNGTLLGTADEQGRAVRWQARVEVDDAVLSDGHDSLLACVVANAGGFAEIDGLPLVTDADPADGLVEVAVALPVVRRSMWGNHRVRVEVRRARGRAASVTPDGEELPYLDDGAAGRLTRRRSWWIEPAAWAVYGD